MQLLRAFACVSALNSAAANPYDQELQKISDGRITKKQLEVVLSQYNEPAEWSDAFKNVRTVYCKGKKVKAEGCLPLRNVGREGHTYLHHIVKNYERLADWTVFSQAQEPTVGYQGHRHGGGHMMPGVTFHDYMFRAPGKDSFFVFNGVVRMSTLDHSMRSTYVNPPPEETKHPICPMGGDQDKWEPYFDLGWFKDFLGEMCGVGAEDLGGLLSTYWEKHIQEPRPKHDALFFAQGARFAVSRERILRRPKSYYVDLLALVSAERDPCHNYFNEWLWYYIAGKPEAPEATEPCSHLPAYDDSLLVRKLNSNAPISGGTTTLAAATTTLAATTLAATTLAATTLAATTLAPTTTKEAGGGDAVTTTTKKKTGGETTLAPTTTKGGSRDIDEEAGAVRFSCSVLSVVFATFVFRW